MEMIELVYFEKVKIFECDNFDILRCEGYWEELIYVVNCLVNLWKLLMNLFGLSLKMIWILV